MTSISPISLAQMSALSSSSTTAADGSGLTFNSATPAAPGSGVANMVGLFSPPAADGTPSTSSLYLGMLQLPVVALDYGDDDDD